METDKPRNGHGGKRAGAGRKPSHNRKYNYCCPRDVAQWIEEHRRGTSVSGLINLALRRLIKEWNED